MENFVKTSYKIIDGIKMPDQFISLENLRGAMEYKSVSGDIFVATYPKSGTTWMQYIVWEILNDGVEPPYPHTIQYTLCPQIELVGIDKINSRSKPPHVFKTHVPLNRLNYSENAKYIYVVRNPWDVCISYYNQVKGYPPDYGFENGTFEDFIHCFNNGEIAFGDYYDHIKHGYDMSSRRNVLLITYEEMKADHKSAVLKVAEFLGANYKDRILMDDSKILNDILKYTSFDYMKTLPSVWGGDAEKFNVIDVGKNLELADGDKLKKVTFFRVGKSGYGHEKFNDDQKALMVKRMKKGLVAVPKLAEIWRSYNIPI